MRHSSGETLERAIESREHHDDNFDRQTIIHTRPPDEIPETLSYVHRKRAHEPLPWLADRLGGATRAERTGRPLVAPTTPQGSSPGPSTADARQSPRPQEAASNTSLGPERGRTSPPKRKRPRAFEGTAVQCAWSPARPEGVTGPVLRVSVARGPGSSGGQECRLQMPTSGSWVSAVVGSTLHRLQRRALTWV